MYTENQFMEDMERSIKEIINAATNNLQYLYDCLYTENKEEWRDVVGYEGLYMVSNYGRVKSLERKATVPANNKNKEYEFTVHSRIRILQIDKNGYSRILLYKNGKYKLAQVHRLVAMAFIPNPENKPCVNHLDENTRNNHISNLEWTTIAENNAYGNRNKKTSVSRMDLKTNIFRQPVDCFDMEGNYICTFPSIEYAGKVVRPNSHTTHIGEVCRGKANSWSGYKWKFATEEHIAEIRDKINSGELVNYNETSWCTNKLSYRQNSYKSKGKFNNINL